MREGQENNFNSLPWEEISLARRLGGVQVLPAQEQHDMRGSRDGSGRKSREPRDFRDSRDSREFRDSRDSREPVPRIFGAWNSQDHARIPGHDLTGMSGMSSMTGNVKQQGHWLLRERSADASAVLQSMPPDINLGLTGSRDSPDMLSTKTGSSSGHRLNRNEPNRSSFGMALKDKFNQNPNMYFPGNFK